MNYPFRVAGGQSAFFADFEYRFSDQELLFMRHAPERFVQMGAADWFDALSTGQKFGDELTNTLANHPDFDLTASLGLAISSSAFTEGKTKDTA